MHVPRVSSILQITTLAYARIGEFSVSVALIRPTPRVHSNANSFPTPTFVKLIGASLHPSRTVRSNFIAFKMRPPTAGSSPHYAKNACYNVCPKNVADFTLA